ncbi:hypothetical protein [Sphingomonas lutea]|uniref:hypothetical protein n=1 Tax=Sphingomonas lutea TaxID=1045317 RepID=UPI001FD05F9A|nr:hypothetical protein [Sphingomonas lutea]
MASWFGDDDSGGRRQHRDERPRGRFIGRDDDHRSRSSWSDNNWDRGNSDRDDRSEMPSGWGSRGRESSRDSAPRSRQDYRPITGDYGRSEQYFAAGGMSRGGQDRWAARTARPAAATSIPIMQAGATATSANSTATMRIIAARTKRGSRTSSPAGASSARQSAAC